MRPATQTGRRFPTMVERAIQLFEPAPGTVYTIETASHLTDLTRRTILLYCKYGMVSPATRPPEAGYGFDAAAIRNLRRLQGLRIVCGDDLPGMKMILFLMDEVRRLRSEMRALREWSNASTADGRKDRPSEKRGGQRRKTNPNRR
jgi:DNA-binding transcriptional MerR regulator